MPFSAGSLIVGKIPDTVVTTPLPVERAVVGSFQSLKEMAYLKPVEDEVLTEDPAVPESVDVETPSRSRKYTKKAKNKDDKLIQYKESAFLSDMLSSSKD